jgi:L-amino acid N-acyltransferase YncA
MALVVEPMQAADWPAVRAIYAEGIATGNATFEAEVPEWPEWDRSHLSVCRFVVLRDPLEERVVVAWAALSRVSSRRVYAGVAEVSIYVAAAARGQGLGRTLLSVLVAESERHGFWTLQASMFPENEASIRLHRACGFREVGRRERIGQTSDGTWRNTLLLERRSWAVGV